MTAVTERGRTAGRPDRPAAVTAASPPRRRRRLAWRRLPFWLELVTIGAGYEAYSLVRLAVRASRPAALAHAAQLWRAEGWLHVRVEPRINQGLSAHPVLADAAGYYYGLAHFVLTAAVLAWLYLARPAVFARLRSALVLSTMAANVVFWVWPAAPPRLSVPGTDDTLVTHHILGAADPHGVSRLADLYATMPSLHVVWATWCALAAIIALRSRWRHLAWLYPAATTLVVVATANHFLLDVAAGVTLAVLGLACAGATRPQALPPGKRWRQEEQRPQRSKEMIMKGIHVTRSADRSLARRPARIRGPEGAAAPSARLGHARLAGAPEHGKRQAEAGPPDNGDHDGDEIWLLPSGWRIRWLRQQEGRTVIEVSDACGALTGLVASSSLPLVSVDGGWRGTSRGPGGARQRWALAIGHAADGGPVAVTFTRHRNCRTGRMTVYPAVVNGLWVAAVTGHHIAVRCRTPAAASALRLAPAISRPWRARHRTGPGDW